MIIIMLMWILILMFQRYLSKKENKWLGLILPILCFTFSIVMVAGTVTFNQVKTASVSDTTAVAEELNVPEENDVKVLPVVKDSILFEVLIQFAMTNILTVLLMVIYINCRRDLAKGIELKKMAIQDLE